MKTTIETAKQQLWEAIRKRDGNFNRCLIELSLEDLVTHASERSIPFIISVDLKLTGRIKNVNVHTVNLLNYLGLHGVLPNSIGNCEFDFTYEGGDAPFTDHENNVFSGSICSIDLEDKERPIGIKIYWPISAECYWPDSVRLSGTEEWTEI